MVQSPFPVHPSLFHTLALEAIEALPDHIREQMKDVVVVIEDRPETRAGGPAPKTARGSLLLGLYEGVPLTAWGRDYSGKLPDRITLFRGPIEAVAGSEEEVPRVIRETVWHEVGHYFGLDHEQIGKMEKRWRESRK